MKKSEIIAEIQRRESELFLEVKKAERDFGQDTNVSKTLRASWSTIWNLMDTLGIEPDTTLHTSLEAWDIVVKKVKEREERVQ